MVSLSATQGCSQIESELGKGTTVSIKLPQLASLQVAAKATTEAQAKKLHILWAEDEPPVLNMITEFLTSDGHTVESAVDGRECIGQVQ